jgi:GTP cyclohydrolase II
MVINLVASLSDPIVLHTAFGDCRAVHVKVEDVSGEIVREGALVSSLEQPGGDRPVLLRLQSSCLFSETFCTTDCDCALQLREALQRVIARSGHLLYFYEEGRGAGLMKKFKAIRLMQHQHLDTNAAYRVLDIPPDLRSYDAAAAVLLKVVGTARPITLLTNNPSKTEGLRRHGLNVTAIEPLVCGTDDPKIRAYLDEKRRVLGHVIA